MRNILKLFKKTSGFTLVELLVVIAILGVLATVLLAAIDPLEQINKSKDSTVKQTVDQIYSQTLTNAANTPATGYTFNTVPAQPAGYSAYRWGYIGPAGTTALTASDVIVCGDLRSKASSYTAATSQTWVACGGRKYQLVGAVATVCTVTLAAPQAACP